MKTVKCYGRVKKSVALEKSFVKDFFGDEDYKTSLWNHDSPINNVSEKNPTNNDPEKENKPLKRAGRRKKCNNRYFYPSSPDMFSSPVSNSSTKLTNKKRKSEKRQIINKKIPESNKRNLRKKLRNKSNDIDIYADEVQPKWSEIEEHDLCLETFKPYENKKISVKCISRIQDYDNLSANKENGPLSVIVLSNSPELEDNIVRKKSSRMRHLRNLKNSSSTNNSIIHRESFRSDKTSVEKQLVKNDSESENLSTSPTFYAYLIQCQNQITSRQRFSELGFSHKSLRTNKEINNVFENGISMENPQDLSNSKQSSEFKDSLPPCIDRKISNGFESSVSMKESLNLINGMKKSSGFCSSPEPLCTDKKSSNSFETHFNMQTSDHLINSKHQSSELNASWEPLCVNKKNSSSFGSNISMKNSKQNFNSKQDVSELITSNEVCVIKKSSNLLENCISRKNLQDLIESKRYSSEARTTPEPLCVDEKTSHSLENNFSVQNSHHLINREQQFSDLYTSPKPLCVNKEISNLLENNSAKSSLPQKLPTALKNTSIHFSVHADSDTIAEPVHKNSKNTFSNGINMKNACLLLNSKEQNSLNINHAVEKSNHLQQSSVSFQMSPIHSDRTEKETNKNYGNSCVEKSKTNIITSTPFCKHKMFEGSHGSELDVIDSSGKKITNNDNISEIMELLNERKQISCPNDLFSNLQVDNFQKSYLNFKSIMSDKNCTLSQFNISNLFANSKSSHSLCSKQVLDLSASNASRHSCTSKIAIENVSITTQTKHEIEEAKAKLLELCKQDSVIKFSEVFKWSSVHVKKIGEGTYGEVFIITKGKSSTVLKIIPVSEEIGDDSFQGLQNVLSEVKIAQCLSGLRNKKINQTKNFNKLKSAHLVMGQYPDVLINAWDSFSEAKSTYNDRPDFFCDAQLFVILEQEYGGKDMSNFVLRHAVEAESIFKQIAISLAIAEEEYLFEHRDLHLGNILIQRNRSKKLSYLLRGKPFTIESHGLLVTIIDFTLSRLCETEYVYYNNLADDESLFNQSGDFQFEVYKAMKEHLGNQWHECGLYSNVLWLNFLCVKLKTFSYSRPSSIKHAKALKQLESMEKQLSYCNCATDCLLQCKIVPFPIANRNRDTKLASNSILVSRNSFQKSKASIIA